MKKLSYIILLLALTFSACKKDDDKPENPPVLLNEEEVITTVRIVFTESTGTWPPSTATFRDPDGNGGSGPDIYDTIRLHASALYHAQIILLNETAVPIDTISNEVLEEATDHLFCFMPDGIDLNISRTDSDGTYEVGLLSDWTTGNAGTGTTTVTLKHQPGIKDGTCDPGDTDVEVSFVTIVE